MRNLLLVAFLAFAGCDGASNKTDAGADLVLVHADSHDLRESPMLDSSAPADMQMCTEYYVSPLVMDCTTLPDNTRCTDHPCYTGYCLYGVCQPKGPGICYPCAADSDCCPEGQHFCTQVDPLSSFYDYSPVWVCDSDHTCKKTVQKCLGGCDKQQGCL